MTRGAPPLRKLRAEAAAHARLKCARVEVHSQRPSHRGATDGLGPEPRESERSVRLRSVKASDDKRARLPASILIKTASSRCECDSDLAEVTAAALRADYCAPYASSFGLNMC
eukprot:917798-Pleurochrysis_carterae.AAC.2